VLFYPNRSPIATQLYVLGSVMILIKNFVDLIKEPKRSKRHKKVRSTPPPTPQPKKIIVSTKQSEEVKE